MRSATPFFLAVLLLFAVVLGAEASEGRGKWKPMTKA